MGNQERHRLPNRRDQRTKRIAVDGLKFFVSIGIDPKSGQVAEVFLRGGGRTGSDWDRLLDDLGVLISHLLQRGARAAELAGSVGRLGEYPKLRSEEKVEDTDVEFKVPDVAPASWIGTILDVIVAEEKEYLKPPAGELFERIMAAVVKPLATGPAPDLDTDPEIEADGYYTFYPPLPGRPDPLKGGA